MSGAGWIDEAALTQGVIGRRLLGWFIDLVLLVILLMLLKIALFLVGLVTLGLGWLLFGGLWVVPGAYGFFWVASGWQATPGQAAAGLRVVRDDDLERPAAAQALVYAAGYWLSMSLGAVWLLVAFFTRRQRCLHDIVAGVLVARSYAVPAPASGWAWRREPAGQ